MLGIVASYHCMQFQGKLMNQTWKNSKKPSFGSNFCQFGPNLGAKIFFMLDIVAIFHCMQFQGKITKQTWENGKKPTIIFIIFWDFLMFYQISLSRKVKRSATTIYRHGMYELPHELPNDLTTHGLMKLGYIRKVSKFHRMKA